MDTNLINPVSSLGSLRILLHKTTGANSRAGSNTVCTVDREELKPFCFVSVLVSKKKQKQNNGQSG